MLGEDTDGMAARTQSLIDGEFPALSTETCWCCSKAGVEPGGRVLVGFEFSFMSSFPPREEEGVLWPQAQPPGPNCLPAVWAAASSHCPAAGPIMSFGTGVIKEAGADLHICPPVITGQTRGLDEAERNLGLNKESWGVWILKSFGVIKLLFIWQWSAIKSKSHKKASVWIIFW